METTGKATSAKELARALLARPWRRMLALAAALAFARTEKLGAPWDTSAQASVYGMGDASSCIRFRAPPHNDIVVLVERMRRRCHANMIAWRCPHKQNWTTSVSAAMLGGGR